MYNPGPAEVLRAVQKDNIFIEKYHQNIQVVAESLLGQGNYLKWRKWIKNLSVGLYYALTNLSGYQTLGEEYAGLILVDWTHKRVPAKASIAAMIALHMCGRTLVEKCLKQISESLSSKRGVVSNAGGRVIGSETPRPEEEGQLDKTKESAAKLLQAVRQCLPFLLRLHLVIFYLQGRFYHFSKRLVGIHYVLVRQWFSNQNENSQRNLKYLRLMSVINLMLTALHDCVVLMNSQPGPGKKMVKPETESCPAADPLRKCSLCLEVRKNSSLTTCGHLFCWDCIMDWLQTKEECPICRTPVTCSRVVPLQNHV